MNTRIISTLSILLGFAANLSAQTEAAPWFMESIGKIYVVVGVILVIFIGLVLYLVSLDRKLSRLENQILDNEQ